MRSRMSIPELAPDVFKAVVSLDKAVKNSGIDRDILHLVKLRASQINGCAYCVDMHVKESLANGLDQQKLHLVATWRESPSFSERERAALEWTESVTLIADTGVPDAAFNTVSAAFSETEIAQLTCAIGTINLLNRIAVSSQTPHPVGRTADAA